MNDINSLETIVVVFIVLLQFRAIIKSLWLIRTLRSIWPDLPRYRLITIEVPTGELKSLTPSEIMNNTPKYLKEMQMNSEELDVEAANAGPKGVVGRRRKVKRETVNFLHYGGRGTSATLSSILDTTNSYLIRTAISTPDFNIIKDVVERDCNVVDEQITLSLPQPLYLGLMGTMIGVVLGLFQIGSVGNRIDPSAILFLLGGVKIAMIASGFGLLGTVITAGGSYKKAKRIVEAGKKDFYYFIQTEVLPATGRDTSSAMLTFQRNLGEFNSDFSETVSDFSETVRQLNVAASTSIETSKAQHAVLSKLEQLDIGAMAKASQETFVQLQDALPQLANLAKYLEQVNGFVANSRELSARLADILVRSDQLATLTRAMTEGVERNNVTMEFLHRHFAELDTRKDLFRDSLIKMDDVLQNSLEGLRQDIVAKMEAIRNIRIDEEDLLARSDNSTNFGKLKYLEAISSSFDQLQKDGPPRMTVIANEVTELNRQLSILRKQLESIRPVTLWNFPSLLYQNVKHRVKGGNGTTVR